MIDWLVGKFGAGVVAWVSMGLVLCFGLWFGWTLNGWRLEAKLATLQATWDKERAALAQAAASASEAARQEERRLTQGITAAANAYQQEVTHASNKEADVVMRLRADALRLRKQWRGCETSRVSEAAARAPDPDDTAEHRAASAGRIVRAAAGCDAQVKGLQDILKAERP